jgi:hypothetical protein
MVTTNSSEYFDEYHLETSTGGGQQEGGVDVEGLEVAGSYQGGHCDSVHYHAENKNYDDSHLRNK